MGFFRTSAETREMHKKDELRTHYYRNTFEQVVKAFEKICSEEDIQLQQVNKQFGDLYMCAFDFEVFATVLQITPAETSVDMKINFFSLMGFKKPERKIIHLYQRLDHSLNFKGKSLHKK